VQFAETAIYRRVVFVACLPIWGATWGASHCEVPVTWMLHIWAVLLAKFAGFVEQLICPPEQQSNAIDNFLVVRFWLAGKCVRWSKIRIYKG
jgi:hypothetical protein